MQRRRYAIYLACCAGMGSVPGLIELIFRGMPPRAFLQSVLTGFMYSVCVAIPCLLVSPVVMSRLSERPQVVRLAAAGIVFALFAVAGCFVANLILLGMGILAWANFSATFWWTLKICLLITFTFGTLTIILATMQSRLSDATEELHRRQVAEERERKIAAEARYASLESRVHPHFLFNTLNSISALVREDPPQAERTIERLAALLRFSLDSELAGLVSLREELRIVKDYLEIEKVRFGSRLRYRIEALDEAGQQMVPALSVQTLVENSVKYAVGARREGADIVVSAHICSGRLHIEVTDDGPGFETETSRKAGHGLDLLDRRLNSLYGSSASLEMTSVAGLTRVAIWVAGGMAA